MFFGILSQVGRGVFEDFGSAAFQMHDLVVVGPDLYSISKFISFGVLTSSFVLEVW